jgi:Fe-S cluster assembly protein SufD
MDTSNLFSETAKNSLAKLKDLGFPNRKTETWKYTRTAKIVKTSYNQIKDFKLSTLDGIKIPDIKDNLVVVENGIINSDLTSLENSNINIEYFNEYSDSDSDNIDNENPFTLLNQAFLQSGLKINISDNIQIKDTLHIVHITTDSDLLVNSRILINVGKSSELKIIESFVNNKINSSFVNHITQINLKENSKVILDKIQCVEGENHICSEYINQEDSSSITVNTMSLDANLIRNGLNVKVNGQNCNTVLNGIFLPQDKQHVDNHTLVEHIKANCYSDECYKGIMQGKSTGVFNGKITIFQDAQKIMAYQQNNNLLLSKDAKINAKPELEIYADDVKCSHGSTTGQLDNEALFYLQSRGISKKSAIKVLSNAFVSELLDKIENQEVSNFVGEKIDKILSL